MRLLRNALVAAWLLTNCANGQVTERPAPTPAAVKAAVDELRRDPNIGRDTTVKSLRWVARGKTAPPASVPRWIVGLFEFINQAAGLLLWVAGGVGAAFAAVWVYRVVRARRARRAAAAPVGPSQVQGLDIRPASLPADVGAAALELLRAGRVREALSLLYRGALSRAVHNFSLNIAESFTEGEVLRAATLRLDPSRAEYFAALVGLWQRAVYAGDMPVPDRVATLCADFSAVLDGARA